MTFKKIKSFLIAILIFIIASLLYFNPVLSGKQIKQSDIIQFSGMSKEIIDFRKENNKEPYWLDNAFSGMPAYQVSAFYPNDFINYFDKLLRFLPRPADYLFLYFIGFFILLLSVKVDWNLAILGSLSFGFSTYLIIIFGAGHNAKAHAIAYMPLVISGVIYIFKKRYLLGFIITSLAMALEVFSNHPQMTYYLGFILLVLVFFEFFNAYKNKKLIIFLKQSVIILIAIIIGIGVNSSRLMSMKEYSDYSNRGKSELTINPDGTKKDKFSGLDKDYITEYSYGKLETFNLFIPRFMGGGTVDKLNEDSNFYKVIEKNAGRKVAKDYSNQALTYWGEQPIVEAPAYIGAVIFFLFFLGIFLFKGIFKYWLICATALSIVLSWGKNMSFITDFFINYVPLYDKFRAVSSIQVIAELCVPLLGFLGLREFFSSQVSLEEKKRELKKALLFSIGLIIIGVLLAFSFSTFEGLRDEQYNQLPSLIDALISDRKSMLLIDSFRSILLVVLTFCALWLYKQNKIKKEVTIFALGVLILGDLIFVDVGYVNKDNFTYARKIKKPFLPTQADKKILEDKGNYRVVNFTSNFMNEARTSYFHKSIGGYHAAKMKRYQELFEYNFNNEKRNPQILNMLNTKYMIVGADQVQLNTDANGNAWFINKFKTVKSADEAIFAFDSINTKTTAIIRKGILPENLSFEKDTTALIKLKENNVNKLIYTVKSKKPQFVVFSEIFYKDGWNAYLDGKLTPHYRVDYVLRGMEIPSGEHNIEFKFEPNVIKLGVKFSLFFYFLLILIPLGWFLFLRKKK